MPTLLRDRSSKSNKSSKSNRSDGDGGDGVDDTTTGSHAFYIDDTGRRRIDPRIRARRDAVQQGHRRRRRRRVLALLGIVTVAVAGYFLARSSLLAASSIDVTAGKHTSADEIRKAAGLRTDDRMLDIDVGAVERNIEALPWVDDAVVERQWPRTVSIRITERTARAILPDGHGGWLLVDETGRVLEPTPDILNLYMAHIDGVGPVAPGQWLDARTAAALAVARRLTPSLAGRLQTIKINGDGTIDLKLLPRGTAVFGRVDGAPESDAGRADLDTKLRALQTMLAQADLRDLCRLDLRAPSSPVLTRDPLCA